MNLGFESKRWLHAFGKGVTPYIHLNTSGPLAAKYQGDKATQTVGKRTLDLAKGVIGEAHALKQHLGNNPSIQVPGSAVLIGQKGALHKILQRYPNNDFCVGTGLTLTASFWWVYAERDVLAMVAKNVKIACVYMYPDGSGHRLPAGAGTVRYTTYNVLARFIASDLDRLL